MSLQVIETREVEFHGDQLVGVLVIENGKETVYVPVKRLCDPLGLEISGQRQRIKRDEVLSEGAGILPLPSTGGDQDTFCIRYDLIPMWLTGVSANAVRPEVRERLKLYRKEAAQVLAAYFLGSGISVNERRATAEDVYLKSLEMQLEISRNQVALVRGQVVQNLLTNWGDDLHPEERRLLLLNAAGVQAPKVAWIEADEIAQEVSRATGASINGSFIGRIAKAFDMQPLENQESNHWAMRQRTPAKGVVGKRVDQVVYLDAGARRLKELGVRVVQANLRESRAAGSPKGIDTIKDEMN